jgi:beta-lactamase class A
MIKIFVIFLTASLLGNIFFLTKFLVNEKQEDETQLSDYPYLARRIFSENPNDVIINFVPLRQKLRGYIEEKPEKIGVFFEYLATGVSVGVNDRQTFFRASLVKVPGIMSAYKLIEEEKLTKNEELVIEDYHLDSDYGSLWQRGAGAVISVGDAISYSIKESDNTAYEVLNERVNDLLLADVGEEQNIDDVYDYLDIPRDSEGLTQEVTPRNYSSILRSLFFSAYLSYHDSNELLDLMTQSTYKKGIAGPLEGKVKVAHKFGIHNVEPDNYEVHSDCGIVYLPQRPYILCIMIDSGEEVVTSQYMQEISKIIYEYISEVN